MRHGAELSSAEPWVSSVAVQQQCNLPYGQQFRHIKRSVYYTLLVYIQ
jgi:hypothetical protein